MIGEKTIDELGALRIISGGKVISSLSAVKKGRIVSLAQKYEEDMPTIWFHGPFFYSTFRTVQGTLEQFKGEFHNKLGSMICRYELSDHTGTHVDSLNHASEGFELYGGIDSRKVQGDHGSTLLGIDTMPPVVTRGILLDFPAFFGVDMLDSEYEITSRDIGQILSKFKISIRPGDAVLFYTGYSKLWGKDNSRYISNGPGPGLPAARALLKSKISITGADTASYEVERKKTTLLFPCHQLLIKQNGIHLVENMKLDELAAANLQEFLFICTPLKLKGGAGSPVAPIALF